MVIVFLVFSMIIVNKVYYLSQQKLCQVSQQRKTEEIVRKYKLVFDEFELDIRCHF